MQIRVFYTISFLEQFNFLKLLNHKKAKWVFLRFLDTGIS